MAAHLPLPGTPSSQLWIGIAHGVQLGLPALLIAPGMEVSDPPHTHEGDSHSIDDLPLHRAWASLLQPLPALSYTPS
jgi:hypothetical protein